MKQKFTGLVLDTETHFKSEHQNLIYDFPHSFSTNSFDQFSTKSAYSQSSVACDFEASNFSKKS